MATAVVPDFMRLRSPSKVCLLLTSLAAVSTSLRERDTSAQGSLISPDMALADVTMPDQVLPDARHHAECNEQLQEVLKTLSTALCLYGLRLNCLASHRSVSLLPQSLGDALPFGHAWLGDDPWNTCRFTPNCLCLPRDYLRTPGSFPHPLGVPLHWVMLVFGR